MTKASEMISLYENDKAGYMETVMAIQEERQRGEEDKADEDALRLGREVLVWVTADRWPRPSEEDECVQTIITGHVVTPEASGDLGNRLKGIREKENEGADEWKKRMELVRDYDTYLKSQSRGVVQFRRFAPRGERPYPRIDMPVNPALDRNMFPYSDTNNVPVIREKTAELKALLPSEQLPPDA